MTGPVAADHSVVQGRLAQGEVPGAQPAAGAEQAALVDAAARTALMAAQVHRRAVERAVTAQDAARDAEVAWAQAVARTFELLGERATRARLGLTQAQVRAARAMVPGTRPPRPGRRERPVPPRIDVDVLARARTDYDSGSRTIGELAADLEVGEGDVLRLLGRRGRPYDRVTPVAPNGRVQLLFRMVPSDLDAAKSQWGDQNTGVPVGRRVTWSAFVVARILAAVQRLEAEHHAGVPWPPLPPGRIRPGGGGLKVARGAVTVATSGYLDPAVLGRIRAAYAATVVNEMTFNAFCAAAVSGVGPGGAA